MVTTTQLNGTLNGSTGLLERRAGASTSDADRRLIDDAVRESDRIDSTERSTFAQTTRLSRGE